MKMPEYVVVKIMPDKKGTSYSLEVVADTDFVNVVRCKDCKYWNGQTKGCVRNPCVEAWRKNDFCSYGER